MKESWIDFMKGLAILLIIACHCHLNELPGAAGHFVAFGRFSVEVFFIISAYLSFESYHRFIHLNGVNNRTWLFKKILRLYPLYFLSLLFSLCLGGEPYWLGNQGKVSWLNFLSHICLTHGLFPHFCNSIIGVEWYIGVLALFYLFVPFLYKTICSLNKASLAFIATAFISLCINVLFSRLLKDVSVDKHIYSAFIYKFSFVSQIPTLMLGLVFYHLRHCLSNRDLSRIWLAIISCLIGSGILFFQHNTKFILFNLVYLTVLGIGFLFIITGVSMMESSINKKSIIVWLGKYSYPVYLFHFPLIKVWRRIPLFTSGHGIYSLIFSFIIITTFSALVSFVLVRYFEKPISVFWNNRLKLS